MTVSMWENACLRMVDPRELLLDRNARTVGDISVENPELVASVGEHGVVVPVIANPAGAGRFRVRDGHSRTLAAVLAVERHPVIPVLVTESLEELLWQRLRDQWITNEIRAGLSASDKAKLLEQLSLFGLSADDIAVQLSASVELVEAGLAVRRSAKAVEAVEKYPQLDMLQAAALAEFAEDTDASGELEQVLDKRPEQYDHTVSLLRRRKATREAVAAKAEELRAGGVTVIDDAHADGVLPLSRLLRSATKPTKLTERNHASCAGHAAAVGTTFSGEPHVVFVCRDYKERGHVDPSATGNAGSKTEEEKAAMRRTRANNEAWRAAQVVRREFLASLMSRTAPPKQLPTQLLLALIEGGRHLTDALGRGSRYACTLLGVDPDKRRHGQAYPLAVKAKRGNGNQVQMMLLAVLLGGFESAYDANHSVNTWRRPSPEDRFYFATLKDWGYTLSTVELLVLDPDADADQWQHLATAADRAAVDTDGCAQSDAAPNGDGADTDGEAAQVA